MFAGHKHISIRSLPGMADRVVRLGSAGKTFSLTAWKVSFVTQLLLATSACSDGICQVSQHAACHLRVPITKGHSAEASADGCPLVCGGVAVHASHSPAAPISGTPPLVNSANGHAPVLCLQVGWVTGPARLVAAIAKAHQFVAFCIHSNLQRAVAFGLQHEQPFYKQVH